MQFYKLMVPFASILTGTAFALTPVDLAVDLTTRPGIVPVASERPSFSWKYALGDSGTVQCAYQIQVATATVKFRAGDPDLWDSGKVESSDSLGIRYAGAALPGERDICWRVRVWDESGIAGPWSQVLSFRTASRLLSYAALRYPQAQKHEMPVKIFTNSVGRVVVDFGRISWGWAELLPPMSTKRGDFSFVFSTGVDKDGIPLDGKDSFRVRVAGAITTPGIYRIPFLAEPSNTVRGQHASVRLPDEIGVIRPFRYVEIKDCPYRMTKNRIRKIALSYPLDQADAAFVCDSPELESVWRFSRKALAAATFAGAFVDGELRRMPEELSAWVQQAGHCALYGDYTLQRYSQAYLCKRPGSSPFALPFAVMMALRDYMYTGDARFLPFCYPLFKERLLAAQTSKDGLYLLDAAHSAPEADCDAFVPDAVSSPFNAAMFKALVCMERLAEASGNDADAALFSEKAKLLRAAFLKTFFNVERGCFIDGAATAHASLCANTFALACGLVPDEEVDRVAGFCVSRGMACGLFGSQMLLESLMQAGFDDAAISLMMREERRGWLSLAAKFGNTAADCWPGDDASEGDIGCGAASAPANIIPRYLLGVRPLEPGFSRILIAPQVGRLRAVEGVVPTARGKVAVGVRRIPHREYRLTVEIPPNAVASVSIPAVGTKVTMDGAVLALSPVAGRYAIDGVKPGKHTITVEE